MRDFPKLKEVKVKIFDEEHALRRISFVDFMEIVPELVEKVYQTNTGESITPIALADAALPCISKLLKLSFPSFTAWDELPIKYSFGLLEIVWDENDISGMIGNFTNKIQKEMGGKIFPKI